MPKIQYLEIVTPDVEATCKTYTQIHNVTFTGPHPALGNAYTAKLEDDGADGGGGGTTISVRAPMHESETPVVRPYFLTENIEAAIQTAVANGAEIAHPPMQIPGDDNLGTFAIYIQGGIHQGLWQL